MKHANRKFSDKTIWICIYLWIISISFRIIMFFSFLNDIVLLITTTINSLIASFSIWNRFWTHMHPLKSISFGVNYCDNSYNIPEDGISIFLAVFGMQNLISVHWIGWSSLNICENWMKSTTEETVHSSCCWNKRERYATRLLHLKEFDYLNTNTPKWALGTGVRMKSKWTPSYSWLHLVM